MRKKRFNLWVSFTTLLYSFGLPLVTIKSTFWWATYTDTSMKRAGLKCGSSLSDPSLPCLSIAITLELLLSMRVMIKSVVKQQLMNNLLTIATSMMWTILTAPSTRSTPISSLVLSFSFITCCWFCQLSPSKAVMIFFRVLTSLIIFSKFHSSRLIGQIQ